MYGTSPGVSPLLTNVVGRLFLGSQKGTMVLHLLTVLLLTHLLIRLLLSVPHVPFDGGLVWVQKVEVLEGSLVLLLWVPPYGPLFVVVVPTSDQRWFDQVSLKVHYSFSLFSQLTV